MTDRANYVDWSTTHADSKWTHTCCDHCWFEAHHTLGDPLVPFGKAVLSIDIPTRIVDEDREWGRCCGCGKITRSGIYVRADQLSQPFCPMRAPNAG